MNIEKLIFAILCAVGGCIIGVFASQLSDTFGCLMFGIGVGLVVSSAFKLNK